MRFEGSEAAPLIVVALGGKVCGVDRATGKTVWKNHLQGGGVGDVYLLIERDVVFASASGGLVFCLDYATGKTIWDKATTHQGRATLLLDGQHLFVAKAGVLDCFTRQGKLLWSNELEGMGLGAITIGLPHNVAQADGRGG